MIKFSDHELLILFGALTFLYALFTTPLVIELAQMRGWIVAPRKDRWHTKPTALMGGIAIYFSFLSLIIAASTFVSINWWIILAASIMFFAGLVDDLIELKPIYKLLVQVASTFLLIYQGYIFGSDQLSWIGVPITFFWVIGITNAINLLDNMDGLSAGISCIVAIIIGSISVMGGHYSTALIAFILAGATLGFLRYNFNPARIFMGDSGSLFLGFTLSYLSLAVQKDLGNTSIFILLILPLAIMVIPIMDTSLVTIKRLISGRKIYVGGKDHTSHRLVALGLTEKKAVLLLYSIALVWGLATVFLINVNQSAYYLPVVAILLIITSFFGLFLSNVKVYNESEEKLAYLRSRGQNVETAGVLLRLLLMNKKILVGVSFDILVISASFYLTSLATGLNFIESRIVLALFILVKILAFFVANSYRKTWRYISVSDLNSNSLSGLVASLLLFVVCNLYFKSLHIEPMFYVVDFIVTLFGIMLIRVLFKYFRETILRYRSYEHKVLIYGAGELGNMLSKQLFFSEKYRFRPVGFIDDDSSIVNTIINGIEVMGTPEQIVEICNRLNITKVIAASNDINDEKLLQLKNRIMNRNIEVFRFEARMTLVEL